MQASSESVVFLAFERRGPDAPAQGKPGKRADAKNKSVRERCTAMKRPGPAAHVALAPERHPRQPRNPTPTHATHHALHLLHELLHLFELLQKTVHFRDWTATSFRDPRTP